MTYFTNGLEFLRLQVGSKIRSGDQDSNCEQDSNGEARLQLRSKTPIGEQESKWGEKRQLGSNLKYFSLLI